MRDVSSHVLMPAADNSMVELRCTHQYNYLIPVFINWRQDFSHTLFATVGNSTSNVRWCVSNTERSEQNNYSEYEIGKTNIFSNITAVMGTLFIQNTLNPFLVMRIILQCHIRHWRRVCIYLLLIKSPKRIVSTSYTSLCAYTCDTLLSWNSKNQYLQQLVLCNKMGA